MRAQDPTSTQPSPGPQLWIVAGPSTTAGFLVPVGRSTIGRGPTVEICLADNNISRRHALLYREGDRVTLTDAGSTNGTLINQRPLRGSQVLYPGDVVRIGRIELVYDFRRPSTGVPRVPPSAGTGSVASGYSFGGVHGPVQTGDGIQYAASGNQNVAHGQQYLDGRDRFYDQSRHVRADGGVAVGGNLDANDYSVNVDNDYDPWDEMFQGRGPGRALMAIGGIIALLGFGLWVYFIFTGFSDASPDQSPFEQELLPGIPMAPVGFGAFLLGGILAGIGGGMSKAARKRAEQRRRSSHPRYR